MTPEKVAHLVRAACEAVGKNEVVIIGSQALVAQLPGDIQPPHGALMSVEVDMYFSHDEEATELLDIQGYGSPFHETHGYYIDPVSETTAVLPQDWGDRQVRRSTPSSDGTRTYTAVLPSVPDLIISKLAAAANDGGVMRNDLDFVREALSVYPVKRDELLALADKISDYHNRLYTPLEGQDLRERVKGLIDKALSPRGSVG